MRILVLGNDNFVKPLRALGHEVRTAAPGDGADLPLVHQDPEWRRLSAAAQAKRLNFDAILVTDDVGRRTLPTGLWAAEAVTVFYGVDAPLNRFWQMPYARLFDVALLDQPQEAADLAALHGGAAWLPVGVDLSLYDGPPAPSQVAGVGFVGVVNETVRPKRSAILSKLAKRAPLHLRGGRQGQWFDTRQAALLYRQCQVVLNENLFPGVTTRPLEVLAAGGSLLSEAAPGAMDRFFRDGEHLCFFGPDDIEQKLELLLGSPDLRRRLAEQGREEVRQHHGLERRAQEIVRRIESMLAKTIEERPRAKGGEALRLEGEALLWAGLRWPAQEGRQRLLRAAGRLQAAASDSADPLESARGAGRAMLSMGNNNQALAYLRRAWDQGGPADGLAWSLAAWGAGQRHLAGQALASLGEIAGEPGQASFHLDVGRLLTQLGLDLAPGFNRQGQDMALWGGFEHLLEATSLDPGLAQAWECLGDMLLARGAANQAHHCLGRARALADRPELACKQEQAARQGYLT
ncbi:MAG: glycosyltransferase family 1 protein [Desulfarculus sp.]|nr:glycosyltransferase family 1 protein [Desulfarculus sp.]